MKHVLLVCSLLLQSLISAQSVSPSQPLTIMIVPQTEPWQRVEQVIRSNPDIQTAINALGRMLEQHGYVYKDLLEVLETLRNGLAAQQGGDPVHEAIRNAPVDMYIYIRLKMRDDPSETPGQRNRQVQIQLYANDKYSADRYATSRWLYSTIRHWGAGLEKPIEEALKLENGLAEFLQQVDKVFANIMTTGRVANIEVNAIASQAVHLDALAEPGGMRLGSIISKQIKTSSLVVTQESGDAKTLRLQCRTPVRSVDGKIRTPYDFGQELADYIRQYKITGKAIEVSVTTINATIRLDLK
jgi:Family of unknown function (DUF6175)